MGTMMLRGLAFLLLCQLAFSKKKPDYETPPDDWGQDKMEFRLYTKGKKYGYNLISINWKKVWYKFSKRPDMRMFHIGGVAGHFLKDLIEQSGVNLEDVHVIGFSYGGQVGSNMCKKFQELTGEKVPRFTALDPGSIGFRKPSQMKHAVNKNDARLVDVIHTSADIGTPAPAGHVDFYPNGGDLRKGHKKAVAFYEKTI